MRILIDIAGEKVVDDESESVEVPFLLKTNGLEIFSEPPKGKTGVGSFTIVEVKDCWGRLKSGAGWIDLRRAMESGIIVKSVSN